MWQGGETVWCSKDASAKTGTGTFGGDGFWRDGEVAFVKRNGYVQLTGCINVNTCDRSAPSLSAREEGRLTSRRAGSTRTMEEVSPLQLRRGGDERLWDDKRAI